MFEVRPRDPFKYLYSPHTNPLSYSQRSGLHMGTLSASLWMTPARYASEPHNKVIAYALFALIVGIKFMCILECLLCSYSCMYTHIFPRISLLCLSFLLHILFLSGLFWFTFSVIFLFMKFLLQRFFYFLSQKILS
jgi:hypothetical protein